MPKFKQKLLPFEQPQLESNPLLAVHDSLFITFTVNSESAMTSFFILEGKAVADNKVPTL
jgi:hypothetical protein